MDDDVVKRGASDAGERGVKTGGQQLPQGQSSRAELVAAVILGLATILMSWTAFQSAKWSGLQDEALGESAVARTMAAQSATRADQQVAVDAEIFVAWVQAAATEVGPDSLRARGYSPKAGTLSTFLLARFRQESKVATEAWLATRPFQNPNAPSTPFVMPEYRRLAADDAERLTHKAEALWADGRRFNLLSDRYVGMSVLFSTVLFLAGVSSTIASRVVQRTILGLAIVVLAVCSVVLAAFPVALY